MKQEILSGSGTARASASDWLASEHVDYLRGKRKHRRNVRLVQTGLLLLFFGLWEVAARQGWIDRLLFSSPSRVWDQLLKSALDGSLWHHLGITVWETAAGFVLGTLVGTLLAALIWWSPFLSAVLDPYMVVFNSMPKVALGPIFIVMFGAGFTAIVMTTLSITVIVTTLVVYNSFQGVDPNYVRVIRSFGGGRGQVFSKVILPASFPAIISTLKVNVGMSWVGVIVGEFLVAKSGLGYLIIYGFQVFNFTLVMSSLLVIAIVATLMYQVVVYFEKLLLTRR
ncbi:ABC transporter permease [Paenibacillus sp. HN-1]|uniref:ABC transporter permease n=1 Tax=Paenibacillus TaxID=44249 RepID=UPI001CA7BA0D|nr:MULTISPECIES: ABC transporter permease [Paenibacillus]MBY9082013.1 ABC transporter permease [Paenibacillus sp. CGMCC 1.18879]MBY9085829.1 ABC transporter permease [Paenibacillus sinensis]